MRPMDSEGSRVNQGKRYLTQLDVLRGIAIIAVVAYHFHGEWFRDPPLRYSGYFLDVSGRGVGEVFRAFFPTIFGWAGVELFFVISGFVIHYSYLNGSRQNGWLHFFNRRFWRLYPPYLITVIFFSVLMESGTLRWKDVWTHAFLVHNMFEDTVFSINASYWSLALEWQYYLLYPFMLFLRSRWGMTRLIWGAAVVYFGFSIVGQWQGWESMVYDKNAIKVWVLWLMGAMAAEAYLSGIRLFPCSSGLFWLLLVGFIPLKMVVFFPYLADFYIAGVSAMGIEHYLWNEQTESGWWEKWLIEIGKCSYSMYLLHYLALITLTSRISCFGLSHTYPWLRVIDGIVLFGAVFLISKGFYLYVEVPSIQLGRRIEARLKKTGELIV